MAWLCFSGARSYIASVSATENWNIIRGHPSCFSISFLLFNLLLATIICWGIQGAAFLYPYIVDLWVCNEAFGIISGLMNGLLWGTMGICYLFSPRQIYKKSSVLS
ncbi:MAG: hypothetical protein U0M19_08205 [Caecibacter sp.]|nr:hypothetical protein [Caecibacter sp.]